MSHRQGRLTMLLPVILMASACCGLRAPPSPIGRYVHVDESVPGVATFCLASNQMLYYEWRQIARLPGMREGVSRYWGRWVLSPLGTLVLTYWDAEEPATADAVFTRYARVQGSTLHVHGVSSRSDPAVLYELESR